MIRLDNFADDVYSQFGEDGIIAHIFDVVGTTTRLCVEFGAWDGEQCSNTANLWKNGWRATLIEGDSERFEVLATQQNVTAINAWVSPKGPNSIDSLLTDRNVDFMSIDIDGNDYWIWHHMETRPRVICIEHNPTVPPHVNVKQGDGQLGFGASAAALIELAERKDYSFIGMTHGNCFFVVNELADHFQDYERDPTNLKPYDNLTYVVTDYSGNAGLVGSESPWGINFGLVGIRDVASVGSTATVAANMQDKFNQPVLCLTPSNWHNVNNISTAGRRVFRGFLQAEVPIICIAVDHCPQRIGYEWIFEDARFYSYEILEEKNKMVTLMRFVQT